MIFGKTDEQIRAEYKRMYDTSRAIAGEIEAKWIEIDRANANAKWEPFYAIKPTQLEDGRWAFFEKIRRKPTLSIKVKYYKDSSIRKSYEIITRYDYRALDNT